jgi:hypothetical protein
MEKLNETGGVQGNFLLLRKTDINIYALSTRKNK